MAFYTEMLVSIVVLATCVYGSTTKSSIQHSTNHSTHGLKGICLLEVPTVDLIDMDERHGAILKGNGSRSGFSKIQICCSGYKLQDHSAFQCTPDCPNGCDNGYCSAPNVCECQKGYIKGPDGNCIPTCPIGCPHGVCLVTKTCLCNAGYTLHTNGQVCLPICIGGCGVGGNCVEPDVCKCKAGFDKTRSGICQHHCEKGCEDGDCVAPNKCVCHPGYHQKHGICKATCAGGCKNGDCVGPNRCACKPGWTLNTKGTVCTPVCKEPCLNGKCTAPDQCTCKTGYTKDVAVANKCVVHCPSGCENGVCSAHNLCICNKGYTKQGKGSDRCIKRNRRSARHNKPMPRTLELIFGSWAKPNIWGLLH